MPPLEEMVCHLIQKRTEVAVLPATEDIDHRFSEENPTGLEEYGTNRKFRENSPRNDKSFIYR
jgi:hypothetical protein